MSLIEQALRKLQEPLLPKAPEPTSVPSPQRPVAQYVPEAPPAHSWPVNAPPRDAAAPNNGMLILLVSAVLICSVALLVGGAWWLGRAFTASAPPSVVVFPSSAALQPPPAVSPAPSAPPRRIIEEPRQAEAPAPKPRRTSSSTTSPWLLSGIVQGQGLSYAVINGAIAAIGDDVGGYRLVEINEGAVRLRRLTGREELVLKVPR